jgi:hypothetical protein
MYVTKLLLNVVYQLGSKSNLIMIPHGKNNFNLPKGPMAINMHEDYHLKCINQIQIDPQMYELQPI